MPLGAYSVIRFSNTLNDQRVNLGVIVWHPLNGIRIRLSSSLSKVHAVYPQARADGLRIQLDEIKSQVEGSRAPERKLLEQLSSRFKEGIEVTAPYPAKMSGLNDLLDRLFDMLVSPPASVRRNDPQEDFRQEFIQALYHVVSLQRHPDDEVHEMGKRKVNGLPVNLGVRTRIGGKMAFWHTISLLATSRPNLQVEKAKAAALELRAIRDHSDECKDGSQFMAIQFPGLEPPSYVKQSSAWLRQGADKVLLISEDERTSAALELRVRELV